MKTFRRITILALTLALICAFSVSAFAANRSSHNQAFMGGDHVVVSSAFIDQISTNGYIDIPAVVAFDSSTLETKCLYSYEDHSGVAHGGSNSRTAYNVTYSFLETSTSDDPLNIKEFTQAVYEFDATFTAYGGTFTYNPPLLIVAP